MGALTARRPLLLVAAPGAGLLEPALEPLDAAARVHELLLARIEGVALGADLTCSSALVERV